MLPLLGFIFISLLVVAAGMAFSTSGAGTIERRLEEVAGVMVKPVEEERAFDKKVAGALKRLGNAVPRSPSEMGKLQQRLVSAGYRRNEAVAIFLGIRVGFALLLFGMFASPLVFRPNFLSAIAAAGIGYVLPGFLLARMAKRRMHRIRLGLPDALDLLVVSVEAGLGLDQAIQRVADELAFAHPELADEMRLINLELRAGKARTEALRNFGERTQVDDVISLVAMLVQTDRFGTSIGQALRTHAETSRTKRRQRAEEKAAKLGVKLLFPLVFCLFPAFYVVVLGPSMVRIFRDLVWGGGIPGAGR